MLSSIYPGRQSLSPGSVDCMLSRGGGLLSVQETKQNFSSELSLLNSQYVLIDFLQFLITILTPVTLFKLSTGIMPCPHKETETSVACNPNIFPARRV